MTRALTSASERRARPSASLLVFPALPISISFTFPSSFVGKAGIQAK